MKLKAFAVYDVKTGAYMRPFFSPARGMAVREFGDIAIDKSHPIGKHPEDFSLFELGEFNDQNGDLVANHARECVCTAMDFQVARASGDLVDEMQKPQVAALAQRVAANGGDL